MLTNAISEFTDIAEQLAPELQTVPFYVLAQPAELPTPLETVAYCIRGRDIALRDFLRQRGEWKGYGAAIVFVDQIDDRLQFLGTLLHELGHALPATTWSDTEPTAEERERQIAAVRKWADDPAPHKEREPWTGHGLQFVRRVLHLHYRSLWHGIAVPLAALNAAGSYYGLSPIWRYLSALGAEPFDLSGKSFAEIESIKPPAAFVDLFVSDVGEWTHKLALEQP